VRLCDLLHDVEAESKLVGLFFVGRIGYEWVEQTWAGHPPQSRRSVGHVKPYVIACIRRLAHDGIDAVGAIR